MCTIISKKVKAPKEGFGYKVVRKESDGYGKIWSNGAKELRRMFGIIYYTQYRYSTGLRFQRSTCDHPERTGHNGRIQETGFHIIKNFEDAKWYFLKNQGLHKVIVLVKYKEKITTGYDASGVTKIDNFDTGIKNLHTKIEIVVAHKMKIIKEVS